MAPGENLNARRVLVVDDDPSALRLMTEAIEHTGAVTCTSVESGEEAVGFLEEESFDLLIVDKNLPGLNGIEVTRLAHSLTLGIPVLMVTGYPSEQTRAEAESMGVAAYLQKPFDLDDFRRIVHQLLATGGPAHDDTTRPIEVVSETELGMRESSPSREITRRMDVLPRPEVQAAPQPISLDVLVVEPDTELRGTLTGALTNLGCRVVAFASARQAEPQARYSGYDVLVARPDVVSISVARGWAKPRDGRHSLGALAIMDRRGVDRLVEAIQIGALGVLSPPFEPQRIEYDFREAIERMRAERERRG